jgi:hypothetical protein
MGKPAKKQKINQATIRVRAYDVLSRAVDEGVGYGINRTYKHWDGSFTDEEKAAIDALVKVLTKRERALLDAAIEGRYRRIEDRLREQLNATVESEVMNSISEYFDFAPFDETE